MNSRTPNTKSDGRSFDAATIEAVWRRAQLHPTHNGCRLDACGAVMLKPEYGNTNSQLGWEIDHIIPVSKGGSDALSNLQPLQWQNNRRKGDNHPKWFCAVTAA